MKKKIAFDVNKLLLEINYVESKLDDKNTWGQAKYLKRLLKSKWKLIQEKNRD